MECMVHDYYSLRTKNKENFFQSKTQRFQWEMNFLKVRLFLCFFCSCFLLLLSEFQTVITDSDRVARFLA